MPSGGDVDRIHGIVVNVMSCEPIINYSHRCIYNGIINTILIFKITV